MKVLAVFLFLGVVRAQTNLDTVCNGIINSLDCKFFDYKPLCATDGVQYNTECECTKAHYSDPNLKVLHEGPCQTTGGTPQETGQTTSGPGVTMTIPPDTPAATSAATPSKTTDPNLYDLCNQIINTPCQPDDTPVCANNGNTYPNYCRFSQARCYLPGLQIAYAGTCSGTDTFPTLTFLITTTRQPSVFEIICRTLEQVTCEQTGVSVCGSNGVTYPTACDFEKAKCKDVTLTVKEC